MAKRTYNRRGRQTAKTPVRNDGRGRTQRQTAARVARDTGSKDRVTRGRGVTSKVALAVHKVPLILPCKVLAVAHLQLWVVTLEDVVDLINQLEVDRRGPQDRELAASEVKCGLLQA